MNPMTQIPGERTVGPEPRAGRTGLALCLSGGGYRAALFHLGALRRLNELGLLARARTVSGVSGGSLTTNLLAAPELRWPSRMGERGAVVGGFEEGVAGPLARLCSRNVRTPSLAAKLRPDRWCLPDAAVRALAGELADTVTGWERPLRDLPPLGPELVTGATEIAYGVNWVFAAPSAQHPLGRLGDYRMGYAAPPPTVRVADAIAASCAFPPFFAPMVLDGDELQLTGGSGPGPLPGPDPRALRHRIRLTDGGVYDDLALEPVWKDHRTVIVSDGGSVFRAGGERTVLGRMLRILEIATGAGRSVRLRWLHASLDRGVLLGVTWGLDALVPGSYPPAVVELIDAVRTDLDAFSEAEQHILERHGYLVADHTVRTRLTGVPVLDTAPRAPHDDVADPAVAARALADSAQRTLLGRF